MFKMNLFAFTFSVSMQRRKLTGQDYQDKKRINQLVDDIKTRRVEHTRWI